jgi:hypothetical protein
MIRVNLKKKEMTDKFSFYSDFRDADHGYSKEASNELQMVSLEHYIFLHS